MNTESDLVGTVALVTGGSRGIGAAVALSLAEAGADVAVSARDLESLTETCSRIEALGQKSVPIACDVTRTSTISEAISTVERELGPIDILINNAGVNLPRPALDVSEDQWDAILDTNLKGAFFCAQQVGSSMVARRGGRIVNIASAAGLIPARERAAYCASKAGLVMLTRVLALEWAEFGVSGERGGAHLRRNGTGCANPEPARDARVLGVSHSTGTPRDDGRRGGCGALPGLA